MTEGFGQYVERSSSTARIRELKRKIEDSGTKDPEDLMMIIMEVLKEDSIYPEVGKFYTFRYAAKTPKIKYDRHPLITMLSYDDKGFEGLNVHWRTRRRYNWEQVMSSFHVLEREEFNALRRIPYARFVINR